ncbi:MAG: lysophospholipase [Xanthobacteraceae bacterium]|jgi:alpha-beta hydrolase superfamily lysophospholipase
MTQNISHRDGQIPGQGGLSLYWQTWRAEPAPPAPGPTVVIVHGFAEHSTRYVEVAKVLADRGCTVYAIDHRGHGRSAGRRAFIDSLDNVVADMDQLVEMARREQPGSRLILLGHSLGGGLSLEYAIRHQEKLDALILSGPLASLQTASTFVVQVSKILSSVAPTLGVLALDPSATSRDPAEVEAYVNDPLNFIGKMPARTGGVVVRLVQGLPARLGTLTLPLLIMHGKEDTLTSPAGSEMVMRTVRSPDKTLLVYEGLRHEIFKELRADRDRVFADLTAWIDARFAVAVPAATAQAGTA